MIRPLSILRDGRGGSKRLGLIVTTSFPEVETDPSGHFVLSSARLLAAEGHAVTVLAPRPARFSGITVRAVGAAELFGWPGAAARALERPLRLLQAPAWVRRVRCEVEALALTMAADDSLVVQAHFWVPVVFPALFGSALVPPRLAWWLPDRASLFVHAHGADVRALLAFPAALRHAVVRATCERASEVVFAAEPLRSSLERALPPALADALRLRSRVAAPPLGLEVSPLAQAARAARANRLRADMGGGPLVVMVGRLVPGKRVERALAAAALARRSHPNLRLAVVGDGPERVRLAPLASSFDRFVGSVPRDEALAWIAAADALVLTSDAEGAPTVVREARALGTTVVCTPVGDVPRWAETDAGLFVGATVHELGELIARAVARSIAASP
jgi:teichuronic acid biosynthesis glycosyltransferase TuaC